MINSDCDSNKKADRPVSDKKYLWDMEAILKSVEECISVTGMTAEEIVRSVFEDKSREDR